MWLPCVRVWERFVLKMGVFGLEVHLLCLFALGGRVFGEGGGVVVYGVERERRRERERENIRDVREQGMLSDAFLSSSISVRVSRLRGYVYLT